LNIIDDMGVTHGTLVLDIAAGAAHVSARPLQEKIHFKKRHIRVPQSIEQRRQAAPVQHRRSPTSSTPTTPTESDSYTEVQAQTTIKVPRSKKASAADHLNFETRREAQKIQSKFR